MKTGVTNRPECRPTSSNGRVSLDSGNRTVLLAVAECLMEASIDQIVRYETLSLAAGCDVRDARNRWALVAARRHINRLHGIVFACERRVGYRRLAAESAIRYAGEKGLKRSRNAARNARHELQNALRTGNDLSAAERRAANQRLAVFGLIEHLTKPKTVATLPEDEVGRTRNRDLLKTTLGL